MDNERRVKILERSFEIMEEMLLKCFASNEEELRHNLKIETPGTEREESTCG